MDEAETVLIRWWCYRERDAIPRPNEVMLRKLSLAERLGRQQNQLLSGPLRASPVGHPEPSGSSLTASWIHPDASDRTFTAFGPRDASCVAR